MSGPEGCTVSKNETVLPRRVVCCVERSGEEGCAAFIEAALGGVLSELCSDPGAIELLVFYIDVHVPEPQPSRS